MQSIEYPMFTSHPRAKLYKRLTNDTPIKTENGKIIQTKLNNNAKQAADDLDNEFVPVADDGMITIQSNRYVCVGTLKWIEHTEKQVTDEQPINGLIIPNAYVTIKTNSLKKFDEGDVIQICGNTPLAGLWLIMDEMRTDYVYTPRQVQRYQYLPLSSAGLN